MKRSTKRSKSDDEDSDFQGEDPIKKTSIVLSSRIPLSNIQKANRSLGISAVSSSFKMPLFANGERPVGCVRAGTILGSTRRGSSVYIPLYDPEDPDAILLYTPPKDSTTFVPTFSLLPNSNQTVKNVHVMVDPKLARVLRPHQIEGVKFLYECVTGAKKENAYGCIMADEMGLGKTLQCITLLWTLLKQSPIPGKPTIEKAIIVCPSSLVKNWAAELKKWLGPDRIRPFAVDNKSTKDQTITDLERFTNAHGRTVTSPVLIISYETLRGYTEIIKNTEIGLMLCDEGHRLKNVESLTYVALSSLNVKRRVVLTGTPVQNDLGEYYALLSFAIPVNEFRKLFENPIARGRDSEASDKEKEISESKMKELLAIANQFMIRRTAALLTKYLPVKYEHVVFCKMAPLQNSIYENFVKSKEVKKLLAGDGQIMPLQAITTLKKLCNHPALVCKVEGSEYRAKSVVVGENVDASLFPEDFDYNATQSKYSGKLQVLERMLTKMRNETTDKMVLISNYTQTLDMFEKMCRNRQWGSFRLDGSLTIQKRQKMVERFNDPTSSECIFLLSSKAGGCGLNLIGANRLVLFDPDWNPANDGQALARVWRDGQTKVCFIYRFIATGTIEEKIFQRQAHKQALSSSVIDEEENVERHFSRDMMRQLFILNNETACDTHDTFKCKRCANGKQIKGPGDSSNPSDTSTWNHYSAQESGKIFDPILRESGQGIVTFVFQNKSHEAK